MLGTFGDSGGADYPPFSIGGYANQTTAATPDSLDIELSGGHSVFAVAYDAFESDTISVGFDLTTESVIQLSGGIFPGFASDVGELLDSHGNTVLVLSDNATSASTVLQPGTYKLDATVSGGGFGSFANTGVQDFDLSLDAGFTPVTTPEPRWVLFAAFLAIMIGGYAVSWLRRVVM